MITKPTVLILGAGASVPYGFPTGGELKQEMLQRLGTNALNILDRLPFEGEQPLIRDPGLSLVARFQEALRGSQQPSPDAFLEHRPEFLQLGKYLIAYRLIARETQEILFRKEDWYTYLLNNKLDDAFDDFGKNRISIITFNYDRSLEEFLFATLKHRYNKSDDEVASKLAEIPIVHVYGQLGRLPWDRNRKSSPSERPYARELTCESVLAAANGIKIIPEGEDDTPEFRQAKELLQGAERIYFLGFGYHPANMKRLGMLRRKTPTSPGHSAAIKGTRYGLTDAEVRQKKRAFPVDFGAGKEDIKILEYLRNDDTFLLEK